MRVALPELCLVCLVGASGSGKSTFARRHFRPSEIVSSDACRLLVADDAADQSATADAFEVLRLIVDRRLARGRLTVVDATSVQGRDRRQWVQLAREHDVLAVAVVLLTPEALCLERNAQRAERAIPPEVVRRQSRQLRRELGGVRREGFRYVHVLREPEDAEQASVIRERLWVDRRDDTGPFDIVGDVHGCFSELREILGRLGYALRTGPEPDGWGATHPGGRRVVFLGDLVDRGPDPVSVLQLVMGMAAEGSALCVPGNHDILLLRALQGRQTSGEHGLAATLERLSEADAAGPGFRERVIAFLDGLVSHYVLDGGRLVVAHAGLPERLQGRASGRVRDFALFGETTGESDAFGLPVRYDWARDYRGRATVAYGHTPVPQPEWVNGTIDLDTGCAFGGRLSALRYPEKEIVSVPASRVYYAPLRPPAPGRDPPPAGGAPLLDVADFLGPRRIETELLGIVRVEEENAAAALEVVSRWGADPRWLVYLPPTMAPPETSGRPGLLEHPEDALAYYRGKTPRVVCEEKHMGSRIGIVLCRDAAAAASRFGVDDGRLGACFTRTGRPFFPDARLEEQVLARVGAAMEAGGLWRALDADWVCLDAELLPWSLKAGDLIRGQYAAVGSAGRVGLDAGSRALRAAEARGVPVEALCARTAERAAMIARYTAAYRPYCWPVHGVGDLRLAPFHLLAAGDHVHAGRDHGWHLQTLAALCRAGDGLLRTTDHRVVDLEDEGSVAAAAIWWEELTAGGGEGMVVKPWSAVTHHGRRLVQPALKCRGPEYLRLIYGPEYRAPENLERLRARALAAKRALALREFALGMEALRRFTSGEPPHRVHECVLGVLALESRAVDPRL